LYATSDLNPKNHPLTWEKTQFFKPYVTSKKKGGTGLGTYSAMLIAEAHQGNIRLKTSKKKGTHVVVKLPQEIGKVV
jgi:signal transduction histidine kinase